MNFVYKRSENAAVFVHMELARIIINDHQIVYLREVNGDRQFPIVIGYFEASSIDRRVKNEAPPRPLTHELLKNTIEELGGELQDVVINNLLDHTYYGLLRIQQDGEIVEVDCRPSDAIALAVQFAPHLPIYVDEEVLAEAAN